MIIYNHIVDNLRLDPYEFQILNILINEKDILSLSDICKKVSFSKSKVIKTISCIEKKGYITIQEKISDLTAYSMLKDTNIHKTGCLFCGYNKSFLDEHHYPIRAKDGGTNTISICSNCHREFHYITDYSKKYVINANVIFGNKSKTRLFNER